MSSTGDLTYFNLCGITTTVCSPSSPVCKRAGLWSTQGFGNLKTQKIGPIELEGVAAGNGVTVTYTNGEYCPGTSGTSSKLHIVCGNKQAVTNCSISSNGCTVTAIIESKAGCGKPIAGTCQSEEFSSNLAVRVPLFDRKASGSFVEVSQRFELNTTASGDLHVAINCINFMLDNTNSQRSYPGSIVIRAVDPKTGKPGAILAKVNNPNIQPINASWYSYTESLRLFIPANFKRFIYISYLTLGDQNIHTSIHASNRGVEPFAPSYMWTNITNSWEELDIFYGHLGMNADIVVF